MTAAVEAAMDDKWSGDNGLPPSLPPSLQLIHSSGFPQKEQLMILDLGVNSIESQPTEGEIKVCLSC